MNKFWVVNCVQRSGKTCQTLCPGYFTEDQVYDSIQSYIEEKMRYNEYIVTYTYDEEMLTSEEAQHIEANQWAQRRQRNNLHHYYKIKNPREIEIHGGFVV